MKYIDDYSIKYMFGSNNDQVWSQSRFESTINQLKVFPSELCLPRMSWAFIISQIKYMHIFYDEEVLVDEKDESSYKVIGYAVIRNKKIKYFEIIPEYRNQGIATRMLTKRIPHLWNGVSNSINNEFWKKIRNKKN